jgi:hypothetical protein
LGCDKGKRGRQMVRSQEFSAATAAEQPFPLALDDSAPEELLKAGKYDWVSDYAKQIVQSKFYAVGVGEIEIALLAHSYWKTLSPDDTRYDQPEVGDALRFGAQYPDEQCESPIVFPHEPWAPPDGSISFVLVLRIEEGKARGLSYTPHSRWLNDWWTSPRIALRKRASTRS